MKNEKLQEIDFLRLDKHFFLSLDSMVCMRGASGSDERRSNYIFSI